MLYVHIFGKKPPARVVKGPKGLVQTTGMAGGYDLGGTMNILICDDEVAFLDVLYLHIQEYMKNRYIPCIITLSDDPVSILQSSKVFDLAFLDIQMPGADGLTLAKELRKRNPKLALFFITNYDEYQDDAMDLQAFRFFKKPFNVQRLYAGLDKAMEYIDGAYVEVFFTSNSQQEKFLVDDILYITIENRKVLMVSKRGSFYTRDTMEQWCEKLPHLFFYSVHKSFLVNLHYVRRYSYSELLLDNGAKIPIAPKKRAAFRKFWFAYLGGRQS